MDPTEPKTDPKDRVQHAKAMGLRALSFRYEGLDALPASLKSARDLLELNLTGNAFKTVPGEVLSLAQLEFLYLEDNRLTGLPDGLWALAPLRDLSLGNSVTLQSDQRYGRRNWRDIDGNRIDSLPPELGDLTALRRLSVPFVGLRSLPDEMGKLKALREANFAGNALNALPKEIAKLKRLEVLDISANHLTVLPDDFAGLTGLRHLRMGDVPGEGGAGGAPPVLAPLDKLETLALPGCGLKALPDWVLALSGLKSLCLAHNPIDDLPDTIAKLAGLAYLDLSGTDITEFPRHLPLPDGLVVRLGPQRLYQNGRLAHAIGTDGKPLLLDEHDDEDDEDTLTNPPVPGPIGDRPTEVPARSGLAARVVIHEPGKPRELDDDDVTQATGDAKKPTPARDDGKVRYDEQTQIAARSGARSGAPQPREATQPGAKPPGAKPLSGLAARVQAFADEERSVGLAPTGPDEETAAAPPRDRTEPTKATQPAQPAEPAEPEQPAQSAPPAPSGEPSAPPSPPPSEPPSPPPPASLKDAEAAEEPSVSPKAADAAEEDEEETESQELDPDGKPVRKSGPD